MDKVSAFSFTSGSFTSVFLSYVQAENEKMEGNDIEVKTIRSLAVMFIK